MIPRAMLEVAYATRRASHAREVKGDDPDIKGHLGPPGWGFGAGLTNPHSKKLVTKIETTAQSPQWAVVPIEEKEEDIV
jgi:hypothetical protein